jgi:nucleoside-diphosphate-sugar epimerase
MTVFVSGATGVFGHRIVDRLAAAGYDVLGLTRERSGAAIIEANGGEPVRADLLDSAELDDALAGYDIDVVVHAATRLPPETKTTAEYWERNGRVRRAGARNLLGAVGDTLDQFLFPSVVWVARQPDGSAFDETATRHPDRSTQSAADVEDLLAEASERHALDATILRTGFFYGPDGRHTRLFAENLLAGDLPIVGGGALGRRDAELSLLHLDDAADAVRAAVETGVGGCYHVVDERPVELGTYLTTFAELLDAPAPRRIPWWLARPLAGKDMVRFLTNSFPTTNERFREATGWEPRYRTYRDGLEQIVERWSQNGTLAALEVDADADTTVPSYREPVV